MFVKAIKSMLRLTRIEALGDQAAARGGEEHIFDALRDLLELELDVEPAELRNIPASGPVIVVANHPTGGAEGILMTSFLQSIRPDFRLLAHSWFKIRPEFERYMFFVDPAGRRGGEEGNTGGLKSAVEWTRQGGMLGLFPSGVVAFHQGRRQGITDPSWRLQVARLVRLTRATVLPLHIEGRNSWLYQLAAILHPSLRIPLLPRELLNKKGKTFRLRIGRPIPNERLTGMDDESMTACLRRATFELAPRPDRLTARGRQPEIGSM